MPKDARSRTVVMVCHCLLNQNAKVEPLAEYPGTFEPLMRLLVDAGVGIIQLPCPELAHLGVDRPLGTDTREQYDSPAYRAVCQGIATRAADLAGRYGAAGYRIACVLGVEGSPSCSVEMAPVLGPTGERVTQPGCGLFFEALRATDLNVPFIGIPEVEDAGDYEEAFGALRKCLTAV